MFATVSARCATSDSNSKARRLAHRMLRQSYGMKTPNCLAAGNYKCNMLKRMVAINNSIIINKCIFNCAALNFSLPNYGVQVRNQSLLGSWYSCGGALDTAAL